MLSSFLAGNATAWKLDWRIFFGISSVICNDLWESRPSSMASSCSILVERGFPGFQRFPVLQLSLFVSTKNKLNSHNNHRLSTEVT